MISRINDFDRLYLDPIGSTLFFEYTDAPGIIAKLSGQLSEKGINIIDIRAPQNLKSGNSLAVIKVCSDVSDADLKTMKDLIGAVNAFKFNA